MLNHNIITAITVTVILDWVVRSSTDAPVIHLRLSWQPNPFRSLRVALDASCRVAVVVRTERRFKGSLSSRRVACEIRKKYMTCQAGIGQTPLASLTLQPEPSRSEPNQFGAPEFCAVLLTHRLYLFDYPDSLIHFDRSASLSTRPVASLLSWGLSVALRDHSRRVVCEISIKYMTCQAGIGQTP